MKLVAVSAAVFTVHTFSAFAAMTPQLRTGSYTTQTSTETSSGTAVSTTTFSAETVTPGEPFRVEFRSSETYRREGASISAGPDCTLNLDDTASISEIFLIKVGAGKTFYDGLPGASIEVLATGTQRLAVKETAQLMTDEFYGGQYCVRIDGQREVELTATVGGTATRNLSGCFQIVATHSEGGPSYPDLDYKRFAQYDGTVGTVRVGSGKEPCPGEQTTSSSDIASSCGKARFDFHSVTHERGFIRKGRQGCVYLVSNRVANGLLSAAYSSDRNISQSFLELLRLSARVERVEIGDAARKTYEEARDTALAELRDKAVAKAFPNFVADSITAASNTVAKANPLFFLGTLTAAPAVPLTTLLTITQIKAKDACLQFEIAKVGGKVKIQNRLIYNPAQFKDRSGSLTRIYAKRARRGRLDRFLRRDLNLECNRDGMAVAGALRDTKRVFSDLRVTAPEAER